MSGQRHFNINAALRLCIEDFIRDFDFVDVEQQLQSYGILTEEECERIIHENDSQSQILRLMWYLEDKEEQCVERFLDIIKHDYEWLHEKIRRASIIDKNNNYLKAVRDLQRPFAKFSDLNVHRMEYYRAICENLIKMKREQFVIICGDIGFGKKWLAVDACCDYTVLKKMNFNIFWLDVHDCKSPEKDLEYLQKLALYLNLPTSEKAEDQLSNKIVKIKYNLKKALQRGGKEDCLLVLTDVQNRKTLITFDLGCKVLITTQNKNISLFLPSLTETIRVVNGLTHFECLGLFEKVMDKASISAKEIYANDIFYHSKGIPFLLNLIAQNLNRESNSSKWIEWYENLCEAKICDDRFNAVIEMSLKVLNEEELEFYKTFVIFNHSIKIPISLLAMFWGKPKYYTDKLVRKYEKFSLIDCHIDIESSMRTCTLHFLYYSYLKKNSDSIDKVALNKKLLEIYKIFDMNYNEENNSAIELMNNQYVYNSIGYHLREAQMSTETFAKYYLNFEFLGNKIRFTGLTNTIGDMRYFRKEIVGVDNSKKYFFKSLRKFLPTIEEVMIRSKYTSLLQYALLCSNEFLKSEALKQIQQYPNQAWFRDNCNFQNNRQMIPINDHNPKIIKLIVADACLIVDDKKILLIHFSLGYNIAQTSFIGHKTEILKIERFTDDHFLTMDLLGEICVWSIADERRRIKSLAEKRLGYNIDRTKSREKNCIQLIRKTSDGRKIAVKDFYIEKCGNIIKLDLAYENGLITHFKWNKTVQKFELEKKAPLNTRVWNIKFIIKIGYYYIVVDNNGAFKVFSLIDGAPANCNIKFPKDMVPFQFHKYQNHGIQFLIFVYATIVVHITLEDSPTDLNVTQKVIYGPLKDHKAITCSALSDNNEYLVLGTKKGITVFDILEENPMLTINRCDSISCVDIFRLDDKIFKYIIVSGSDGQKVLRIHSMKVDDISVECEQLLTPQIETSIRLIGGHLFDVNYQLNGVASVLAVDSKNRIHHVPNKNSDNWSSVTLPGNLTSKITAITASNTDTDCYYGCKDGNVYKSDANHIHEPKITLNGAVTYLKLFSNGILIASSSVSIECVILMGSRIKRFNYSVVCCYKFPYYLLLISDDCTIVIINDSESNSNDDQLYTNNNKYTYGSSDCMSNYICIGTSNSHINIYKAVDTEDNDVERQKIKLIINHDRKVNEPITAVGIQADSRLFAIGLKNNLIEIYQLASEKLELLRKLECHNSPVLCMKFSPWNEIDSSPIILVSCSDKLCIWDISYILNNRLGNVKTICTDHKSTRFNSQSDSDSDVSPLRTDLPLFGYSIDNNCNTNPWYNKKGQSNKPELLSCIKFIGSNASKFYANSDFTQFIIIDNGGDRYHFELLNKNEHLMTVNENYESDNDISDLTNDDDTFDEVYIKTKIK